MPPTRKKPATKKNTATKNKAKKNKTLLAGDVILAQEKVSTPQKEFINIYDQDPVIQSKSRLSWLIVGVIMLVVMAFWFWSLKISMKNNRQDSEDLNKITSEIDNIVNKFKEVVGNSQNVINQANNQINQDQEIEKIKNEVLAQIQINADSANWPEHTSNLLGLALKYPTNWFRQEKKDLLTLANYDLESTSTPTIFTKIIITKIIDPSVKITSLMTNKSDYTKSPEEIFIDLWPVEKYQPKLNTENNLTYLLFVNNTKNIYKLDIYTNNKNIFEATINKILSTIDLL